MFHLLVSYDGWPNAKSTISNSRVYLKAKPEFCQPSGKLDIAAIRKIPALLVTEIDGSGPPLARVAHITEVKENARETLIQYTIDSNIEPISNYALEEYSDLLGLSQFGLKHTHWGICTTDLYKILLMSKQKNAISPKVFSIDSANPRNTNTVSVMMPFESSFSPVYSAIEKAITSVEMECIRADNIWEEASIIQDIVNIISRAKVVVCDCTGKNANVFYEAGIAHTLGKEIILLTQKDEDIPFDLKHLRYLKYLANGEGLKDLSDKIKDRLEFLLSDK